MKPLYQHLASLVVAVDNCRRTNNEEWRQRHIEAIDAAVREHMPSGSGIDSGTTFDHDASAEDKLVFRTAFHHMNDAGMYDGWTEHTVTVKPSLAFELELTISGRNRNDIKDYLHDTFHAALTAVLDDVR
jgi:hypothetical protein